MSGHVGHSGLRVLGDLTTSSAPFLQVEVGYRKKDVSQALRPCHPIAFLPESSLDVPLPQLQQPMKACLPTRSHGLWHLLCSHRTRFPGVPKPQEKDKRQPGLGGYVGVSGAGPS